MIPFKTSALKHLCAVLCAAVLLCLCCFSAFAEPSDAAPSHPAESHTVSDAVSAENSDNTSALSEVSGTESAPESETQPSEVSQEPSLPEVSEEEYVYEREISEDDTPSKIKVRKTTSDPEEEEDDTPRTKPVTAWTYLRNLIYFIPLIIAGLCIYYLVRYNKKVNGKTDDDDMPEDPDNPSLSSFSTKGKNHTAEDKTEESDDGGRSDGR